MCACVFIFMCTLCHLGDVIFLSYHILFLIITCNSSTHIHTYACIYTHFQFDLDLSFKVRDMKFGRQVNPVAYISDIVIISNYYCCSCCCLICRHYVSHTQNVSLYIILWRYCYSYKYVCILQLISLHDLLHSMGAIVVKAVY